MHYVRYSNLDIGCTYSCLLLFKNCILRMVQIVYIEKCNYYCQRELKKRVALLFL